MCDGSGREEDGNAQRSLSQCASGPVRLTAGPSIRSAHVFDFAVHVVHTKGRWAIASNPS